MKNFSPKQKREFCNLKSKILVLNPGLTLKTVRIYKIQQNSLKRATPLGTINMSLENTTHTNIKFIFSTLFRVLFSDKMLTKIKTCLQHYHRNWNYSLNFTNNLSFNKNKSHNCKQFTAVNYREIEESDVFGSCALPRGVVCCNIDRIFSIKFMLFKT